MGRNPGSILVSVALLAGFFIFVTTKHAYAYIDAGTGSLLLQVLLAGLFASLFTLKVFWRRVTDNMHRFLSKIRVLKTR